MGHAWCRDPSRDERVRAAEDGREGTLPTLVEAIGEVFPKQEATVGGLRTERVTLEVTYKWTTPPSLWNWNHVITSPMVTLKPGESVRVVEDCCLDRVKKRDVIRQRDAAIRERDDLRKSWLRSEESGTRLLAERNAALDAADGLRKRVAELEAASGGNHSPDAGKMVGQEPVAWGIALNNAIIPFENREDAERRRAESNARIDTAIGQNVGDRWKCVPLYREPPHPRGWLTEHERRMLANALSTCRVEAKHSYRSGDERAADGYADEAAAIESLLARSTPPEVVHPDCHFDEFSGCSAVHAWNICAADFRKALAAAGVTVKEVGGE